MLIFKTVPYPHGGTYDDYSQINYFDEFNDYFETKLKYVYYYIINVWLKSKRLRVTISNDVDFKII